jgi:hypothetical protein
MYGKIETINGAGMGWAWGTGVRCVVDGHGILVGFWAWGAVGGDMYSKIKHKLQQI